MTKSDDHQDALRAAVERAAARRPVRGCDFCLAAPGPTDPRSWWAWPTPDFVYASPSGPPVVMPVMVACPDCNPDVYRRHWATILDRLAPRWAARRLAVMDERTRAIALRLARDGHDDQLEMAAEVRAELARFLIAAEPYLMTTPDRLDHLETL